jgi:hypothetical protein
MRFVTGNLLPGGGGVIPRPMVDREQRNIFFSPTIYIFSCHYSAGAPYTFGHNHRKQCAKSWNEALKSTVFHTYVWLKLCLCNRHFILRSTYSHLIDLHNCYGLCCVWCTIWGRGNSWLWKLKLRGTLFSVRYRLKLKNKLTIWK